MTAGEKFVKVSTSVKFPAGQLIMMSKLKFFNLVNKLSQELLFESANFNLYSSQIFLLCKKQRPL